MNTTAALLISTSSTVGDSDSQEPVAQAHQIVDENQSATKHVDHSSVPPEETLSDTAPADETETAQTEESPRKQRLFHAVAGARMSPDRSGQVAGYLKTVFSKNLEANATVDGQDHINVGQDAATPLGKKLYLNAKVEPAFQYEIAPGEFIPFASIGGAWNFILSGGKPMLANQWGNHAAISATKYSHVRMPKFLLIMSTIVWARVSGDPELMHLMTISKLPFECYEPGKTDLVERHRHSYSEWYVTTLEMIRRTLMQIKETGDPHLVPDFEAVFARPRPVKKHQGKPSMRPGRMENRRV